MKIERNRLLAVSLALLLALPIIAISTPMAKADSETNGTQNLSVKTEEHWRNIWYRFETPLITLIFPANGKKPMFLWWYTNDSSEIYVVKFKGVIEYLAFNLSYYDRRYPADNSTIQDIIQKKYIEPKLSGLDAQARNQIINKFLWWLIGFHRPYLPFSACTWELTPPELVSKDDVSYWSFNFTLKRVPWWRPGFRFAEDNIEIRCRFYNTTTTETPDPNHPEYNYTVAAGQLKFDFVVSKWQWNIDKIKNFVDWLNVTHPGLNITIPTYKTGLALWINMASIKLEDISAAENDIQNQQENVERKSQMQAATLNDQYYSVSTNETQKGQYERQLKLTNRFRERARIQFARRERTFAGFLEFVPWARLLNETGGTVKYVNVTASYIAAGHHLRLFLCYPYFGNHTLEHDPTIGLASAPTIPTLINPITLAILIGATIAIAIAIASIKIRKKTVNIVNVQ
ncbi:hypothetical protein DRO25_03710 [Candidatus Bathyarchaeota archaeon]|nr:MAG: hypothetical protein DRO25_03710 [Candidatus Bathyarchaeota archaeon]